MIAISRLARRLFSERQIVIRSKGRIRYLTLSRRWIIAGCCVVLVGASGMGRVVVGYVMASRVVADKEAQVAQAEMSNSDLRNLVSQLQDRLAVASAQNEALRKDLDATETRLQAIDASQAVALAQREEAQNRLKAVQDSLSAKSEQIRGLEATKSDLKQTKEQSAELAGRLRQLETELEDAKNQSVRYKASWESAENKVQEGAAEREKVIAERNGLLGRLAVLRQSQQDKASVIEPAPAPAPVLLPVAASKSPPSTSPLGYLADETRQGWSDVAALLTSAGVDLDKLAARFGAIRSGEGGPFVALGSIKQKKVNPGDGIPEELQRALKTLPLAAPLTQYQVESPFGVRVDPMNHRQAMHTGIDLGAPFRSPVYNTAPGTVTFAGARGEYGKMVEIDHGFGISTRYAHLHRILVAKGQRLNGRQEIGQLGSTGRSTGPHVHYEVVVNGTPQDPAKFFQAGRSVLQAAAPN